MKKVCFVFRSLPGRGLGGAEQSMLRLMHHLHGQLLDCEVILLNHTISGFETELRKRKIPILVIRNLIQLFYELKRLKPDIVYLFSRSYLPIWGGISKLAKIPVIVGAVRGSTDTFIDRLVYPISNIFINKYVSNSYYAANQLKKLRIPSRKIFTVYNGVDCEEFYHDMVTESLDIVLPRDKIFIVTVANISPVKGIFYLLKAVKIIQIDYPNVCVMLIGRDYTSGSFFQELEKAGLSNTYIWIGGVKNVAPYLQKSKIFVLPSLHEGMSTAILEAMLAGLPVIATNVGGNPELIADGFTGFLVPPKDINALVKAIRNVLVIDADLLRIIRDKSRSYILQNHSIEKMVNGHLNVFGLIV